MHCGMWDWWWTLSGPAACVMCIRHLMDKLKAAFKEVMQPKEKRQLEDDALVKTMKV